MSSFNSAFHTHNHQQNHFKLKCTIILTNLPTEQIYQTYKILVVTTTFSSQICVTFACEAPVTMQQFSQKRYYNQTPLLPSAISLIDPAKLPLIPRLFPFFLSFLAKVHHKAIQQFATHTLQASSERGRPPPSGCLS